MTVADARKRSAGAMRRMLPAALTAVVLLSLLALAVTFMVSAWQRSTAPMSVHGWIALGLGVLVSIVIGCGLMALMFYSSRRGYDERATGKTDHAKIPEPPPG